MNKIIKVFLIVLILNLSFEQKNFSEGFMDIKGFGSELSEIATLYEMEINRGNDGIVDFKSVMNQCGFRLSQPNENCVQGEAHGVEFFLYISNDNTRGKIRITSDILFSHYEIMNRIKDIEGISLFELDTNVKYILKENIDRTSEKILGQMRKKDFKCDVVNLNRGYEIIVSKLDGLFRVENRMGNYILVEYGNSSCIIFGENEIFMDY